MTKRQTLKDTIENLEKRIKNLENKTDWKTIYLAPIIVGVIIVLVSTIAIEKYHESTKLQLNLHVYFDEVGNYVIINNSHDLIPDDTKITFCGNCSVSKSNLDYSTGDNYYIVKEWAKQGALFFNCQKNYEECGASYLRGSISNNNYKSQDFRCFIDKTTNKSMCQ